jgi:hypothetical protein
MVFGGMCGENSCNVFLLLVMVLTVPIVAVVCMRAVPLLWHVSLLLGLRPAGVFPPYLSLYKKIGGLLFPLFFSCKEVLHP